MRFYPMLAGWLEFDSSGSDDTRETTLQQNSSILMPVQRRALIWLAIALCICVLLWLLSPVLTPFLLGAILAYILQPGVAWMERRRVPRGLSALVMILFFTLMMSVLVLLVLAVIQKKGPLLRQQVPVLLAHASAWLQPKLAMMGLAGSLDLGSVREFVMARLEDSAQTVALYAWTSIRTSSNLMLGLIANLVTVPLVVFYLLYDWNRMLTRVENLVPRRWLDKTLQLTRDMDDMLSQYLRGEVLVMLILAAYYAIMLSLAGFDIALPIGIFTGLAVFIPYLGFATGLVLALLAALLQFGNWYGFGAVALIYGFAQLVESFYLTPRLVGERIGLHPLAVIFALLAFGQLFGFFGVLLALPASAILAIGIRELRQSYLASTLYNN
jgi:predicted PurR-regulated permease PerM